MRKGSQQQIPKQALNPKMFNNDDQNSNMFKVDHSQEITIQHLHFFNKDTQIIKPGQKRQVVFDRLQKQQRSFYQIISPYLYKALESTGNFAIQALKVVKDSIEWVYEEIMVEKVIPFASSKLQGVPQFIFLVIKKNKSKQSSQQQFCILDIKDEISNLLQEKQRNKKVKIVIPLGQSDPQFQQFLKRQNFQQKFSFQIDIDSQDQQQQYQKNKIGESHMIPSQSFQYIYEDIKNMEGYHQNEEKPIVHILPKCAIFQLQGKNSIQYQLLDRIQKHELTQSGYIVMPQKLIKKQSQNQNQNQIDISLQAIQKIKNVQQNIQQPFCQIQQIQNIISQKKIVDRTRNVRVQIPQFTIIKNKYQNRQIMYQ